MDANGLPVALQSNLAAAAASFESWAKEVGGTLQGIQHNTRLLPHWAALACGLGAALLALRAQSQANEALRVITAATVRVSAHVDQWDAEGRRLLEREHREELASTIETEYAQLATDGLRHKALEESSRGGPGAGAPPGWWREREEEKGSWFDERGGLRERRTFWWGLTETQKREILGRFAQWEPVEGDARDRWILDIARAAADIRDAQQELHDAEWGRSESETESDGESGSDDGR